MPLDTIAEGLFGSILRFISWVLVDVVIEVLVKGLGYIILRPFKKVDPDGLGALIVGSISWCVIGIVILLFVDFFTLQAEIDACLDSSRTFNYATETCEYAPST